MSTDTNSPTRARRHLCLRLCVALALGSALTACAETSFRVRYEPGFSRAGARISTFSVKRDGLLSRAGWAALGPTASAPFADGACDVGYSEALWEKTPRLADAIQEYVRNNGVSDTLLARLAVAAKGDTIMLITVGGHPQSSGGSAGGSAAQLANPVSGGGGRGGRGGGGRGGGRGGRGAAAQTKNSSGLDGADDTFQVSASFFSLHERRTMARIDMSYSGADTDRALRDFKQRLEIELPRASCSGWDWSAQIDDAGIRALGDE